MTSPALSPVNPDEIDAVVSFINAARGELFPMLASAPIPDDLARFRDVYVDGLGCFLAAWDEGRLVAVIGYLPYNHRFAQLEYRQSRVVEVVRLFVLPQYRRGGLAARLFAALREQAQGEGVECLYLHTHPFLPGAITFWEKQGFEIVAVEADPLWQTTHMQLWLNS